MKLNIYKVILLWIFIYILHSYVWTYAQQKLKWFMTCLIHQTLSKLVSEQYNEIILQHIHKKILIFSTSKIVFNTLHFLYNYQSKHTTIIKWIRICLIYQINNENIVKMSI